MRPVTIITGGGRGIGAATARQLAAAGHDIAIGYQRDTDAANRVADEVRAAGRRCVTVSLDTADEAGVGYLFAAAADLGPVTGLVNNAGITSPLAPLADTRTGDLRRVIDVNVIGYLLCARQAVRVMRAPASGPGGGPTGAIVNVSSAAATLGSPGEYVHYAASKAAVEAMTVGLAKEVAADGIRVNAVSPGIIRTELHRLSGAPDRADTAAGRIPMGRAGEPEEIAAAIAWLLSPAASYTTGAVLRVAGGM